MRQKLLLTLSGIALYCIPARAQSIGPSSINAAGGSGTISGNTYEYSIGTLALQQTYSSPSLIVTDGVLQPNIAPNSVAPPPIAAGQLSVYPNPVLSTLFVQPGFGKSGTLQYVLTDAAGKTVHTQSVALSLGTERQEINMSALAAGQYTLNVTWQQGGKNYATAYKVQKLQ